MNITVTPADVEVVRTVTPPSITLNLSVDEAHLIYSLLYSARNLPDPHDGHLANVLWNQIISDMDEATGGSWYTDSYLRMHRGDGVSDHWGSREARVSDILDAMTRED